MSLLNCVANPVDLIYLWPGKLVLQVLRTHAKKSHFPILRLAGKVLGKHDLLHQPHILKASGSQ